MVELLSGIPLFFQQYRALLKKNSILSLRNIKHTILQLFSSLFVLLLLFIVLESINLYLKKVISFENVSDPVVGVPSAIPPCEDKFFIFKPCYDFVWSGNHNPRIANIVNAIMRNNPLRPIADTRVKSFKTQEEVDEWLLSNPLRTPVALHFAERSPSVISYGIQTNTTALRRRAEDQDPIVTFQIPLQIAAEREIARFLLGDPNFSWTVGFKYPGTIYESTDVADDAQLSTLLIHLYRMIPLFTFVFQISSVVTEKELKLRQAMSMMGLYESAYWLSWFTWEAFFAMFSSLLTVLLGRLFKFNFFVDASFTLLFLTFFLFQISMIGFAFMLSTLISKSSRSTAWAFLIFIISAGTPNLTWLIYGTKKTIYVVLWNLFPPHLIYQAMNRMNTDDGKSWNKRRECTPSVHGECEITMEGILLRFLSALLFWFVLAIYLDNIIPNSNGVRKPVYYFILPSYWTGKGSTKEEEGSILKWIGAIPPIEEITPDDEDVLAEETLVKEQASKDEIDPDTAVQIRGLAKTYAKTLSFNFRSGFKLSKGFSAVKGIWVNLPKNQLFCLLGPNGAGKTTSISCLTGITPITGGDALIYGHSVRDTSSRSSIQKIMGVCPQFDILWGQLTGREHLHLFSNIKGLPPSMINSETEKALAEVKLTKFAKVRSASYSGGMKRRLSVAIALIGDPKLVFLDEPTTGMDPISRRHVWDIIEHAKKGRAIVLTTHAMEEADILSDRIAIMARGRLRCIGNSLRLKLRFGSGYIATVSFPSKDQESIQEADDDITDGGRPEAKPVKQFFRNYLELEPDEENEKFLNYIIPYEKKAVLTEFFSELEDRKEELGISDIQIGLTTLEEVFMNIVKKAEMEENENAPVAAVPDRGQ